MACRKAGLRADQKHRKPAAVGSVAVSDALLFATMSIIGLPVEVHARDGSVYSGIFHTASVDNEYAIVLRQARMMTKGKQDVNVVEGNLIETLIVQSEDLVQVVVMGVLLSSNGINGYVERDGIRAIGGRSVEESMDREAKVTKSNESKVNKKNKSHLRTKRENGFPDSSTAMTTNVKAFPQNERLDTTQFVKTGEAHNESVDGRQAGDGSLEIQNDWRSNPELQFERTEVKGSNLSIGCEDQSITTVNTQEKTNQEVSAGVSSRCSTAKRAQVHETAASDELARTTTLLSDISNASIPLVEANSESCLSASSSSFSPIPPKSSSFRKTVKESKLNPGAKLFSPSMLHYRMGAPPLVANGTSVTYIPDSYTASPITTQHEVDHRSFSRSSLPVKFVPYDNVATGRGGNDCSPYGQPIIGQVVSRTQPVRYAGQYYNNFQTMPTYIHPNPQNVMHGRVGPLVCMHPQPISSDFVQSETAFSSVTARPLLTPNQMHLPKHQGNASGQALQLCMSPQVIASGAQPFMMPSSIPVSQPLFPVLRPISVPGSNMFMSTKFA